MRILNGLSLRVIIIGMMLQGLGCDKDSTGTSVTDPAHRAGNVVSELTRDQLCQRLGANDNATFLVSDNRIVEANLFRSGVRSIEALKGLPLRSLDLGFTYVTDLSPLDGMPLEILALENVPVNDPGIIKGMPLRILNLQNSGVRDFSFLQGMALEQLNLLNLPFRDLSLLKDMPLELLWLTGTQVTDLTDIPGRRLVSLDIERTDVNSLDPLATVTSLKRLNIAQTPIIDVTPLQNLQLERLVLSPERIRTGMEVLRQMKSLVLIQTSIEQEMTSGDFWKRYDVGVWKTEE